MDRLLVVEPHELVLNFELGSKCSGIVHVRNVMHTMPVAFKVQTTAPHKYLVKPPTGIIGPLATAEFEVIMHATHEYPEHFPLTKDKFMVKSVVVPGNCRDGIVPPSEWFDAYKKVVFVDARLRTVLVGGGILRQLLARPKATMEDIRSVLEREVEVDGVDEIGRSAMHLAVATGRPELVQLLLEYMPNLETKSRQGRTALQQAAEAGEALMVEILLSKGAQPDAADTSGRTALHLALVGGHLDVVRILLEKGANVDAALNNGRTSLHIAVEEGLRKSLKVLLERGACPDAVIPSTGQTALHLAAVRNDKAMVKTLVRCGASLEAKNRRGATPGDLAAEAGHAKLLDALELGHGLREAARKGDCDAVQSSLEMGAHINGQDGRGWGALHRAAFKGHLEVVEFLLDAGADIQLKDNEGHSPLHCAVEARQRDVVQHLLSRGADTEATTNRGLSALGIARHVHLPAILRILEGDKQVLNAAPAKPRGVLAGSSTNRRRSRKRVTFNFADDGKAHASPEAVQHHQSDEPWVSDWLEKATVVADTSTPPIKDAGDDVWDQVPAFGKGSTDYQCTKTPSVNIHITFCNVDLMSKCQRLVNA